MVRSVCFGREVFDSDPLDSRALDQALRVSGVITRGSQFATGGTEPVLTKHPAPRETRRDFRPIRSASGGARRPGG